MARAITLPFPPLILLDHEGVMSWDDVTAGAAGRLPEGVSICVRSATGPAKRGGFFFHLRSEDPQIQLLSFDTHVIHVFASGAETVRFINHASGRAFDEQMWALAQWLNLRTDDQTN